jgi:DNA replication protein DnaC
MTAPAPSVSPELKVLMRRLRLGRLLDTLPERLALARSHERSHIEFLEQLFSDEVQRRDADSAGLRARVAHLDPHMYLEAWDETAAVSYDRAVLSELVSLRFIDQGRNALILGPVGVGKTFLATALGHIACRRRISVHFERADRLHKRLRAARLDASYDAEMRKLIGVELLILDDFALQALDATETADLYELVVERHHSAATVLTSNRDPVEWLAVMADPLLAQSAVDRLKSAAWELVIEGESYRGQENQSSVPAKTSLLRRGDAVPLDTCFGCRDHRVSRSMWTRRGPMLLATAWSLKTGKRQRRHSDATRSSRGCAGTTEVRRVPTCASVPGDETIGTRIELGGTN